MEEKSVSGESHFVSEFWRNRDGTLQYAYWTETGKRVEVDPDMPEIIMRKFSAMLRKQVVK